MKPFGSVRFATWLFLTICSQTAFSGDDMTQHETLIDFSGSNNNRWMIVNDGVMGGLSQSALRQTDQQTGVFAGELSLENSGGFASVRAVLGEHDLSAFHALELRVRGDGRTYQLRLRTSDRFDGVAYRAPFDTRAGEWLNITIPFSDFLPTFRGRMLPDHPALDVSRIQQLAFMLADKSPGSFSLEIDSVRAVELQGKLEP